MDNFLKDTRPVDRHIASATGWILNTIHFLIFLLPTLCIRIFPCSCALHKRETNRRCGGCNRKAVSAKFMILYFVYACRSFLLNSFSPFSTIMAPQSTNLLFAIASPVSLYAPISSNLDFGEIFLNVRMKT